MERQPLAAFCSSLLLWSGMSVTAAPADSSSAKQSVKEQVALTQAGSIVEVKLKNKTKVKGKLGPVSDSRFELQSVANDKIQTQTIAFQDVKSFKTVSSGMVIGGKIAIGVLAAGGIFLIILLISWAATGGSG